MKKTFFSGIQPTAQAPHIGNYIGIFKQWVEMQNEYNPYYCIVDLHALTVLQDPVKLKEAIYASYAMLLAVGIDPKLTTLFVQSGNPHHAELAWILNCLTTQGELSRMTQYKEKSAKQKDFVSVGLYDYPVLMAADILLYDSEVVPVGEDQVQHIELTRTIAKRFNNKYGFTFVLPKPKLVKEGARIMSLQDPDSKMSKSDENTKATLFLLDQPDVISNKVKSAVTDSESTIEFNPNRKGLFNLLSIYKALSGKSMEVIEDEFSGKGYREFKEALTELVINEFTPIQKKYSQYINDKAELEALMKAGAQRAIDTTTAKIREVKEKIGLLV
jgi:tryptophanyl-tRNA synthetase